MVTVPKLWSKVTFWSNWTFEDNYVEGFLNNRVTYATMETDRATGDLILSVLDPGDQVNLPSYILDRGTLNDNGVYSGGNTRRENTTNAVGHLFWRDRWRSRRPRYSCRLKQPMKTAGWLEIDQPGTKEIGTFIANCTPLPGGDTTSCP